MDKCSITRGVIHLTIITFLFIATSTILKWLLVDLILQQARTHHFMCSMQNYCIANYCIARMSDLLLLYFTLLLELQLNHFHNYESHFRNYFP